jgi:hypothetical protein
LITKVELTILMHQGPMAEAQARALAFFYVKKPNATRLPPKTPNPYLRSKFATPK